MLPSPSPMATPMAMAMAMMAHTEDSRPMEMPASTVVAGPVRADAAISLTGPRSVEVNCSVIWLATSERIDAGQHGVEHLEVVHVVLRHEEGADDGEQRGEPEAAVDRGERVAVAWRGPARPRRR